MAPHLETAELLARLVAFDTTSRRSNRPLVDFVADYLDRPGARVESAEEAGKVNLLIRVGPETGGGLALCGHTDTVPAEEPDWTSDPFVLADRGDRWTARGACDMKGFLALAIDRLARTPARELRAPLALLLTCDEEIGSLGAQRLVADGAWAQAIPPNVLIGEPTGLAAVRLHKGHLRGRLEFHGVAAHSGYPHRGVNAIEAAARAVVALAGLQERLRAERLPAARHFPEVPFEVVSVGLVAGGSAVNVIPDRCRVEFGLRLLPGSDVERLVERLRAAVGALALAADWRLEVLNLSPPLETAADSTLHRELCELLGQSRTVAVSYSSDAGALSSLGVDCVLFGPGSIEVAHKPDEYLPKDEAAAAATVLDRLVDRLCRQ